MSKRAKRKTKSDDSYTKKYNFIKKCSSSALDNSFKFWCTIYSVDLSCAYAGINDVDHHIKIKKHIDYVSISNILSHQYFKKLRSYPKESGEIQ